MIKNDKNTLNYMKELERNILDLLQSYNKSWDMINFEELIRKDKLELLNPVQLQKYLSDKYKIKLKYRDAEALEIMILTHSYVGDKYSLA